MKKILATFFLCLCASAASAAPAIYYADLTHGPNTGGQDNKGAFITIWGRGFGSTRGSSAITVGGGAVDSYPVWSETKVSFQLGPNAATGYIVITVNNETASTQDCNPSMQFTVNNDMEIYFVDGEIDSGGSGTYASPWTTPRDWIDHLESRGDDIGDILYFRAGTYTGGYGETAWNAACFMLTNEHRGSSVAPVAYVAYPGETVTITNGSSRPCFQLSKGSPNTGSDYTTISQFVLNHGNSEGVCSCGTDRDTEEGAVYMRVVGCEINGNYGSANTMTGLIQISGDHNYIFGCDFENDAPSAINNNHAVYIQGGADNAKVAYNYFHSMKMGHVIQTHSDGGGHLVYENIHIYNNLLSMDAVRDTRGISISLLDPDSTEYIYNNIFDTLGQNFSAITVYNGYVHIYNNTFYNINAESASSAAIIVSDGGYGGGNSHPYPQVWNNILWADSNSAYLFADRGGTFTSLGNNCYYGNGSQIFPVGGQADSHPLNNTDPGLSAPGNGDFTLSSSGSAAKDAGIDGSSVISELVTDFTNQPRSGMDSIGAYEYGSQPTQSTPTESSSTPSDSGCFIRNLILINQKTRNRIAIPGLN